MNQKLFRFIFSMMLSMLSIFILMAIFLESSHAAPQVGIIYVDADASGGETGADWANAYSDLQSALASAVSGDEIWVANGVYTPGVSSINSFDLVNGVDIYGGFAATETLREQRDWNANVTVLSGDIGGDDTTDGNGVVLTTTNQAGDNSLTVVNGSGVSTTTTLDGFTITAGQADISSPSLFRDGAGLHHAGDNLSIKNCRFIGNSARGSNSWGGGAFITGTLSMENVEFVNNRARHGGAIQLSESAVVTITNGRFYSNTAGFFGGSIRLYDTSQLTVTNIQVEGSRAGSNGGAIHMSNDSSMTIADSTFTDNISQQHGGVIYSDGLLTISQSIFSNNESAQDGGVIVVEDADISISDSRFFDNRSGGAGGVIRAVATISDEKFLSIQQSEFSDNNAGSSAGALFVFGGYNVTIDDSSFTRNQSAASSGAGSLGLSHPITIKNTTFYSNTSQNEGGALTLYSLFGGPVRAVDAGALTLDGSMISDTTIENNHAINGNGGGVFLNMTAGITLTRVALVNNEAGRNGGAIYNSSQASLNETIVHGNRAAESGGGLYTSTGSFAIHNSTISDNTAETVRGGGLYVRDGGSADVTNSTISGNRAAGEDDSVDGGGNGGGIYVGGSGPVSSSLTLDHVTVTDNEAAGIGGGIDFNRGASVSVGDTLIMNHTIVAGNRDSGGDADCYDNLATNYTLTVDSTNLFGGAAGDSCVPGATDLDLLSLGVMITDVLEPLADNGGLTAGNPVSATWPIQTHALLSSGPAVDAGDQTIGADQRGVGRPYGGANDIGAFELQYYTVTVDLPETGGGSISGLDADCAADCDSRVSLGSVISLTATPDIGYSFTGWTEGCSGTEPCVLTITEDILVGATFTLNQHVLTLSKTGDGAGSVVGSPVGIDCGTACSQTLDYGTMITLTATADEDSVFIGWGGEECSGTEVECTFTLTADRSITATFAVETVYIYLPLIVSD